jgi:hypothetical protein
VAGRVREAVRRELGGILGLAELIDEHRSAFEYDWRTRFRLPLTVVGASMSWGEAGRLATILAKDSTSQLAAALSGWLYPVTRESLVLMDYYDAYARATYKRPSAYPRPWDMPQRRYGQTRLTREELRAILTRVRGDDAGRNDGHGS